MVDETVVKTEPPYMCVVLTSKWLPYVYHSNFSVVLADEGWQVETFKFIVNLVIKISSDIFWRRLLLLQWVKVLVLILYKKREFLGLFSF